MPRGMSYRKPVPQYLPSPPHSPSSLSTPQTLSAGRQTEERPPLPENWHDAIAQARKNFNDHPFLPVSTTANPRSPQYGRIQPDRLGIPALVAEDAPQLPRIASPVYLGSNVGNTNTRVGPHRIYRPPTPPRSSDHRLVEAESQNPSEVPLDRMFKCAELPSRRSVEIYAWSIGTAELYTRRESSISSPSSEWQLAELPTDLKPQEHDLTMWWDKSKS
ncbi:hypothetical protein B0H13DRAFT_2016963 [Mycena leptocephala]|nr:hypothetical protein B0H13DRAFT_2016963 [Mycena leptocephala]